MSKRCLPPLPGGAGTGGSCGHLRTRRRLQPGGRRGSAGTPPLRDGGAGPAGKARRGDLAGGGAGVGRGPERAAGRAGGRTERVRRPRRRNDPSAGKHGGASIVVAEAATAEFLAGLPVEALPVEPAIHQRLRLFGLTRLGEVAALPFSAMQAQFGKPGARAWELANGKDDARIVPARDEVRLTETADLPAPAAMLEPIVIGTKALLQRALARPEVRGHSLRRLDWQLTLESGEVLDRRVVFREPTSDPARMAFALQGKIERLQLPAAAVGLAVTLSGLCSEYGHQANLWTGDRSGRRNWLRRSRS